MDPVQKCEPDPAYPKGKAFWIGIWLIALSFGVLAFYVLIPFLPLSLKAKGGIAFVGWIISWGCFLLGTLLAGNEGYRYFKKILRERFWKR